MNAANVTSAELDAILLPPCSTSAAPSTVRWDAVQISDDELADLACEVDERGSATTIAGILAGLRSDLDRRTRLALLDALEHYHLPALLDEVRGER